MDFATPIQLLPRRRPEQGMTDYCSANLVNAAVSSYSPEGGCSLESKGRTFRNLINDEPYVFTGGVYSPLDAQLAERHANSPGVHQDRRRRRPHRGPAVPEALRPHRRQDHRDSRRGDREISRRRRGPQPPGSRLRHCRSHRRVRRRGRQPGRGDLAGPRADLIWSEFSNASRESAVAFARALRESHPHVPLAFNYSSSFKWSSDGNPFRFQELGDLGYKFIFITLYAAHAGMHAVWNAMEDLVKNQEQAQWSLERTKAGHPSHH